MNQIALAKLCETSQQNINNLSLTNTSASYPKQLQTLLDGRLLNTTEIENINKGKNYQCLEANDCWDVLFYAAFFSQGHGKRVQAKKNNHA